MPDREKEIERLKELQTVGESAGSTGEFILPDSIREMLELLEKQEPDESLLKNESFWEEKRKRGCKNV